MKIWELYFSEVHFYLYKDIIYYGYHFYDLIRFLCNMNTLLLNAFEWKRCLHFISKENLVGPSPSSEYLDGVAEPPVEIVVGNLEGLNRIWTCYLLPSCRQQHPLGRWFNWLSYYSGFGNGVYMCWQSSCFLDKSTWLLMRAMCLGRYAGRV